MPKTEQEQEFAPMLDFVEFALDEFCRRIGVIADRGQTPREIRVDVDPLGMVLYFRGDRQRRYVYDIDFDKNLRSRFCSQERAYMVNIVSVGLREQFGLGDVIETRNCPNIQDRSFVQY